MAQRTVLIVDDDSNIRKMTSLRLTRAGYRVLIAERGDKGVVVAQTEHPDVILLDMMMPGMTGREVFEQLQADPSTKSIPVILLTVVHPHDEIYAPASLTGAMYQSKPYKPQELLEKIRSVLPQR